MRFRPRRRTVEYERRTQLLTRRVVVEVSGCEVKLAVAGSIVQAGPNHEPRKLRRSKPARARNLRRRTQPVFAALEHFEARGAIQNRGVWIGRAIFGSVKNGTAARSGSKQLVDLAVQ